MSFVIPLGRFTICIGYSFRNRFFGFAFGTPRILDIYHSRTVGWTIHRRVRR